MSTLIGLTFYMKWSNGHSKMYKYAVGHNFKNETNVVVLPLCMCEWALFDPKFKAKIRWINYWAGAELNNY